jgi:hypothetical protein
VIALKRFRMHRLLVSQINGEEIVIQLIVIIKQNFEKKSRFAY